MTLQTYTAATRYMVVTDFGKIGCEGRTFDCFDDACDEYAGQMDSGDDSRVFAVEFAAGKIADITAEAVAQVAGRVNSRADDMPDWLYAALPSLTIEVAA